MCSRKWLCILSLLPAIILQLDYWLHWNKTTENSFSLTSITVSVCVSVCLHVPSHFRSCQFIHPSIHRIHWLLMILSCVHQQQHVFNTDTPADTSTSTCLQNFWLDMKFKYTLCEQYKNRKWNKCKSINSEFTVVAPSCTDCDKCTINIIIIN